jgi:hypothetical protein
MKIYPVILSGGAGTRLWPLSSDSIDYAVMEHTRDGVVVAADIGWSDVGSWSVLSPRISPIGMTHRLENPGKLPLHLIEVQSGSYLGEDDIVRFEDIYKRT